MRLQCLILILASLFFQLSFSSKASEKEEEAHKGRIGSGEEVRPKFKYPFPVRLFRDNSPVPGRNHTTRCGGVILNRDWIMTAAHCVIAGGNLLTFAAGDHNPNITEDTEQELKPRYIIIHENYRLVFPVSSSPGPLSVSVTLRNLIQIWRGGIGRDPSGRWDIAVVRVEPKIRFTKFVKPINFPRCKSEPWHSEAIAIGWGEVGMSDPHPSLREGKVILVPLDECKKAKEAERNLTLVFKNQLCTSSKQGAAPAGGDSGSPTFQLREKGKVESGYFLLGLVTGPAGNHHVLYTKVADYVGWIHRRISGCGNHPSSK